MLEIGVFNNGASSLPVITNKDGVTVNRWLTTAFLAGSSVANEGGWATFKVSRGLGLLQIENQARI